MAIRIPSLLSQLLNDFIDSTCYALTTSLTGLNSPYYRIYSLAAEQTDVYWNDLQPLKWSNDSVVEEDTKVLEELLRAQNETKEHVDAIRSMLVSMEEGAINVAAYDTAWVSLIKDMHGTDGPQFPSCLEWIANNQLPDGSWGDCSIFEVHDRLINTLACVVALKTWNIHLERAQKGILFVQENLCKLEDVNATHMPIGFEIAFPSLIEIAQQMNINIPNDSPALQEIFARRNLKLTKIPKHILHTVPTTLLHSIEGMPGLQWEKLLKFQFVDGSFFSSPSATAFAFMQTKDRNSLRYLSNIVEKFNGGVPTVYPVDLFERIWVVDKLERLGISRYFSSEIKDCVDYVDGHWTEEGISWGRYTRVLDVDCTAMGFRLLRLHGRKISAEVFRKFKKDGEFFCFPGQSTQAVTGIYDLYRASEIRFPGENILQDVKIFSSKFLMDKQASKDLVDKWVIAKDLPGEVGYALEVPWYASLSRLETRIYLEQYGGEEEIWIGKTLYRMAFVSNNTYLKFGRLDYNRCQALHQLEWESIQQWYRESNLEEFGMSKRSLLLAYYLAAASIFEPERWSERVAWTKTAVLVETIGLFIEKNGLSSEVMRSFTDNFRYGDIQQESITGRQNRVVGDHEVKLGETLLKAVNRFMSDLQKAHGKKVGDNLRHAWEMWMMRWQEEGYRHGSEAELFVHTIYLCGGSQKTDKSLALAHPQYQPLFDVTKRVCIGLSQAHQQQHPNKALNGDKSKAMVQIEPEMQKLVELVISASSDGMDSRIKQIFLIIAKTYYYTAHITPATIDSHISKVLFEKVI